ncbi:hypothetical protein F511_27013 [Dorcoceras hygrometricum]|uniref:Uncharacterized protein n=1 Tax=Dorcoceras hygrometricum TaxID=472368 RepID=A0A2Z7CDD1_9LAMI|nr:hypothetical protein F511_27013 [Dorcoceras hygrometricum]
MSANGESSTTMHRILHASGSHPIPTPYDPKEETVVEGQAVEKADEIEYWFNLSYEEFTARQADRIFESASETYEEQETVAFETSVGEQQLQTFVEPEVAKEIEMETVLADPVITLREHVIDEVSAFFNSFSLRRLAVLTSLNKDIAAKEENVLTWAETDSVQVAIQRKRQAHGLQWTRPCCSMLFEGALDRGFYIPRNHKIIVSNYWLRLLRRIGDVWVAEDGYDRWVHEDETPVSQLLVQLPQRTSLESLAPICLFFQPVHCLSASTPLPVKTWGWYRISPVVDIPLAPTDFVLSSPHHSSSSASSMHFTDDIPQGTTTAVEQNIEHVTSTTTDISASFASLRESISRLVANQTRDSRRSGDAHEEVMSKINHVERVLLDSLAVQNQAFRGLIKSIHQEAHNDNDALSIALKAVRAQNSILSTDLADVRQEVKDLKVELSKDSDDKLAVIRNDLLEFRVETQVQLASLGTNLAELIAFITKGSDDKKGEESSSRHPQPSPDDQN